MKSRETETERWQRKTADGQGTPGASDYMHVCTEVKVWEEIVCRDVICDPEPVSGPGSTVGWLQAG